MFLFCFGFFFFYIGAAEKQRSGLQQAANTELGVGVSQPDQQGSGEHVFGLAADRERERAATGGRGGTSGRSWYLLYHHR